MTEFLVQRLIRGAQNTEDPSVREAYGRLAGIVGVVCNVLLFVGKFLLGTLTGSVSIMADAVNNLSDASSSIVTLIGFGLAAKPADEGHPFGHHRIEYLAGLAVAAMILLIGAELVKTSIGKILHPADVECTAAAILVLLASILVKLWLARFNRTLGKKISSPALMATAADSRNDVITTAAVLLCAVLAAATGLRLDGYVGLLVALFILWSGISIAKDTIDPLLGAAPDESLVHAIASEITGYGGILGIHDLMVHDYGPGRRFASAHAEVDYRMNILDAHELLDDIDVLAAAVIALARIAFCVLIRQHAALRFHHGLGDDVLRGDELEFRALAIELEVEFFRDFRVRLFQGVHQAHGISSFSAAGSRQLPYAYCLANGWQELTSARLP